MGQAEIIQLLEKTGKWYSAKELDDYFGNTTSNLLLFKLYRDGFVLRQTDRVGNHWRYIYRAKKIKRLTNKQNKELIEKRGGICEINNCMEMKNLVVHHITRITKGGTNEESNLKVLCEKHHKLIHSGELK